MCPDSNLLFYQKAAHAPERGLLCRSLQVLCCRSVFEFASSRVARSLCLQSLRPILILTSVPRQEPRYDLLHKSPAPSPTCREYLEIPTFRGPYVRPPSPKKKPLSPHVSPVPHNASVP